MFFLPRTTFVTFKLNFHTFHYSISIDTKKQHSTFKSPVNFTPILVCISTQTQCVFYQPMIRTQSFFHQIYAYIIAYNHAKTPFLCTINVNFFSSGKSPLHKGSPGYQKSPFLWLGVATMMTLFRYLPYPYIWPSHE